jgi:hemoglobin
MALFLFLVASFAAPGGLRTARAQEPTPTAVKSAAPKSLYERLGGVYGVAAVVDDFVDRLLADPLIKSNLKLAVAREHVAGLKFHITALVCEVSGGPEKYTGRSMPDSHANLHLGEKEWQAMMDDLDKSLDRFKVPATERGELVAIVASTKADIVAHEAPKERSH